MTQSNEARITGFQLFRKNRRFHVAVFSEGLKTSARKPVLLSSMGRTGFGSGGQYLFLKNSHMKPSAFKKRHCPVMNPALHWVTYRAFLESLG
jgi:hypothetical protein